MKYIFESETKPTWLPGEGIPSLLDKNAELKGIEIGVDHGVTTEYLLKSLPKLTLIGVDPYTMYDDWTGPTVPADDRENALTIMKNRTSPYSDRFTHVRKTSDDALSMFEDDSFDFIFIDGLHTYKQVLLDCRNYWPKLKKGGLFCGHDFRGIPDVNNAVVEFANDLKAMIGTTNQDVWFWYKQRELTLS